MPNSQRGRSRSGFAPLLSAMFATAKGPCGDCNFQPSSEIQGDLGNVIQQC